MKFLQISRILSFFVLITVVPLNVTAHNSTAPSRVNEITTEDELHTILTGQKPAIIMGYMPHCPHCSDLSPHFEKLSNQHKKVNFYMVNGPKLNMHKHVKESSKGSILIPGYPSIVYVKQSKITDHQIGGSKKTLDDKIKSFIKDLEKLL